MSKRILIFALLAVFIGMTILTCDARAQQQKPAMSPTGFVIGEPVTHPIRLPVLTRDQLVTRGHAEDKAEIAELFHTYMFYHDTHNGGGVASLFTYEGALEHLWNNGGRTVEPNAGPDGKGCFSPGKKEILEMFEGEGGAHGQAGTFPGHSHNQVTNVSVQVYGDTATLYGNFTTIRSNDAAGAPVASPPNSAAVSHNGEDVADLRRTPEGWRFVHLRVLEDEPMKFGTAACEKHVVAGH